MTKQIEVSIILKEANDPTITNETFETRYHIKRETIQAMSQEQLEKVVAAGIIRIREIGGEKGSNGALGI